MSPAEQAAADTARIEHWRELLNRPRPAVVPLPVGRPVVTEVNRIVESVVGTKVELIGHFSMPTMAMEARQKYLERWAPDGYGTRFDNIRGVGEWFVLSGYRFASCD